MPLPTANLSSLPCTFLRHKPSLLFIPTVSGEPKTISDRLFRSICLGDKGVLVRGQEEHYIVLYAPKFDAQTTVVRSLVLTHKRRERGRRLQIGPFFSPSSPSSTLFSSFEVHNLNKREQKINNNGRGDTGKPPARDGDFSLKSPHTCA